MLEALTMCPHKPPATLSRGTLPRHLWPKSVRHNISNIWRQAKSIRRFMKHKTRTRAKAHEEPPPKDPSVSLWSSVNTPLSLRTVLSPPPKDLDTLGLFTCPDLNPLRTPTHQATHDCFKRPRKATRLLIRHARNLRRRKYGRALLRMFVKKPSVALKSILQTSAGTTDNPTLPTDLSIL